jgi:hypothetical protein
MVEGSGQGTGLVAGLALRACFLCLGGTLAAAVLGFAIRVARDPTLFADDATPPALARLCAGCGALSDDSRSGATVALGGTDRCAICDRAHGSFRWRAASETHGQLELLGALATIGGAFFALFLLATPLERDRQGTEGGNIMMGVGAILLPVALLGCRWLLRQARAERAERGHFVAGPPVLTDTTLTPTLEADAWLDAQGTLQRAEGKSEADGTALRWSRLGAPPIDRAPTYREGPNSGVWTLREHELLDVTDIVHASALLDVTGIAPDEELLEADEPPSSSEQPSFTSRLRGSG